MGLALNYRRKLLLGLFAVLVLFACGASGDQWIGWVFALSVLFIILLIDFMFADGNDFIYEPDLRNYARRLERMQ